MLIGRVYTSEGGAKDRACRARPQLRWSFFGCSDGGLLLGEVQGIASLPWLLRVGHCCGALFTLFWAAPTAC